MQDFIACDQHPVTGNILFCCKELGGYSIIYRKVIDLANIHHLNTSTNFIPNDIDDVVCGIAENLIIALEARAEHYDDNLLHKGARRSIIEVFKTLLATSIPELKIFLIYRTPNPIHCLKLKIKVLKNVYCRQENISS
jgi:metal-dependent HD superfamily phosphatase/phosphodiesterase